MNYYIITEQDGRQMYLAELQGDPYYTSEQTHAKAFPLYRSALHYKKEHKMQIGNGRIVQRIF